MTIGTPDSARMIRQTSIPDRCGQHDVQQDEIGALGAEAGERLSAVRGGDDPEPIALERLDQGLAQRWLVLDDQDRTCHRPQHSDEC